MAHKIIAFDLEARNGLKAGVDTLTRAVKVTLGPRGRNVILDRKFGAPAATKDGVSVAKEIELEDPIENMGAQMVREVASKTSDTAGDGTTTATVLAQSILSEGLRNVVAGANPLLLKRGIDKAVKVVTAALHEQSLEVGSSGTLVAQVGSISANNDAEIGELLANAMDKVGNDGVITVEEAKSIETSLEVVEGMQFDRGYISPYFVTDPGSMEVVYNDPMFLICDKKISTVQSILTALEAAQKTGKPLVLIAEDVDGEALATLVVNKMRGSFPVVAIKAPGFGDRRKDILEDIAILTNCEVVSEDAGLKLENVTAADLGSAKRVVITKDSTTIVEGTGDVEAIKARVAQLDNLSKSTKSDYDREKLQERLAKLSGGVAVLHIGAATEVEMIEKKARVEDALQATRAAVEEGIVAGGGVALIRAQEALNAVSFKGDEDTGRMIILRAIEEPLRQIAGNAGFEGAVVAQKVRDSNKEYYGFNALTGDFEDLMAAGIIDPTKVTRSALENAASVASVLVMSEAVVHEAKEDTPAPAVPPMPGGGMGGGMY